MMTSSQAAHDALPPKPHIAIASRLSNWRHLRALPDLINAQLRLRTATKVSRTVRVWGKPAVVNAGVMTFGDRVRIRSVVIPSEFVTGPGGRLEIGERTFINNGASIAAQQLIRIGAYCMIGTQCIMMDNDFHQIEPDARYNMPESQPIILGNHVWIGNRVIILKGVTIGDYAVVGAGSIVTRDVPPYTVVAGNPARVIRTITPPAPEPPHVG